MKCLLTNSTANKGKQFGYYSLHQKKYLNTLKKLYYCFSIVILTYSPLFGQFGPQQIITNELDGPYSIAVADIDGDTFADVVIGSKFSNNKIAWSKNIDGLGSFGPLQQVSVEQGESRTITVADLNGDNDLDIIVSFVFADKFSWFENTDGQGAFGPEQIFDSNADGAFHGFGADVDADGDNDIVAAISQESSLVWYENLDGLGTFGARNYISNSLPCRELFVSDIDNDGDLDVVVNAGGSLSIVWFENLDGLGNFGPQHIVAGAGLFVADVFCSDIDGDGDMDILGCTNAANKVAWFENMDGIGSYGVEQIITTDAIACSTIFCADLDNDGDNDVLYASTPSTNIEDSEIAWSENLDGLGTFSPKQIIDNTLQYTTDVFVADVDNDGDKDVFASSQNNDKVVWYENLTILNTQDFNTPSAVVYPNPVKEVLVIESPQPLKKVTIYSVLGNKLLEVTEKLSEISMKNLPNGLLFVFLETENGSFTKKILKE